MIGAGANSYMHVVGSQWQRERNEELEWAAVSWGGALRDDPNNGCEGDYQVVSWSVSVSQSVT